MALKGLTWKIPSVETVSTSLTYVALTGALLAPLATATPRLPPAIEAKVTTAAPQDASPVKADTPAVKAKVAMARPRAAAAEPPATQEQTAPSPSAVASEVTGTARELRELPPPTQIAEVRARLKMIKAKDMPSKAQPPAYPPTADVRITETNEAATQDSKREKTAELEKPSPPAAAATVPDVDGAPAATEPLTTWSDADIAAALKECLRLLAPVNAEIEVNTAMRKGQCGTPAPIMLKSVGTSPKVTFQPAVEVNCQMAVALGEWARDTLQPAARDTYGSEVKSIVGGSGYSCRNRYGLANERLSEHALANAVDIAGFALANGKTVRVTTSWGTTARDRVAAAKASNQKTDNQAKTSDDDKDAKSPAIKAEKSTQHASLKAADLRDADGKGKAAKPTATDAKVVEVDGTSTPDGQFLRRLHKGACGPFGTVLGPEANEAHRDHFHFDLKARKHHAVCQ